MSQPSSAQFNFYSNLSSSLEDPISPTTYLLSLQPQLQLQPQPQLQVQSLSLALHNHNHNHNYNHQRHHHNNNTNNNNNGHHIKNDKLHKSIKRSLSKLTFTPPNANIPSNPVSASSSTGHSFSEADIFERTCSKHNYHYPLINNPETPSHYNLENYTSPILDTATEILSNNIPLDQVKLNCYCDENENENEIDKQIENENEQEENADQIRDQKQEKEDILQPPSTTTTFIRPRARSIISQTLISTLDHNRKMHSSMSSTGFNNNHNHNHNNNHNHNHNNATATATAISNYNPLPPPLLAKRLMSYAGQTPYSQSKGIGKVDKEDNDPNTIDFFSFADIINHEEVEEEQEKGFINTSPTRSSASSSSNSGGGRQFNQMVSPSPSLTQPPVNDFHPIRRGSCVATISAKDYIGRF